MARATKPSGPLDRLKSEAGGLAGAFAERAVSAALDKVEDATGRLTEYATNGGGPGLTAALTGAKDLAEGKGPIRSLLGAGTSGLKEKASGLLGGKGKGKGGKAQKLKITNIVESIDVGVPLRVAYDQWTQFSQFPTFMKKVENVGQAEDDKLNWKAQIFWSHRTWEATIIDQRPDERIVWRSKAEKGHVDGAVTFHELAPNLTRIVLVLEYHPQGLFEQTGNIWRAQGRRARLELKHFQRHVTTNTLLHPDKLEGWRGVIEDSKVVKDHETAVSEEQAASDRTDEAAEDELAADESAEYEDENEEVGEPAEDEDENENKEAGEPAEDEEAEEEEAREPRRRTRARAVRNEPTASKAASSGAAGRRTTRSTARRAQTTQGGGRK
jgi:uncharacterized membrane protein